MSSRCPRGVFRPYAGVSTAVLVFTKGGTTEKIWFYDMEHDGFSLDDKRQRVPENDIPDIGWCAGNIGGMRSSSRSAPSALAGPAKEQIAPLKKLTASNTTAIIHRLKFEEVVARRLPTRRAALGRKARPSLPNSNPAYAPLANGDQPAHPANFGSLRKQRGCQQIRSLRQQVSRIERELDFLEKPVVTLDRLRRLDDQAEQHVAQLAKLLQRT